MQNYHKLMEGYLYMMAISLGRAAMADCRKQAASPESRRQCSEITGDSDEEVKFVLEYIGQTGGVLKSCEGSTAQAGTLLKYLATRTLTVNGKKNVRVDAGYDTFARILTACGVKFAISVTPVALCPEPVDVSRHNTTKVAPWRILLEAIIMFLLGGTWITDNKHHPVSPRDGVYAVVSANQYYGRGNMDSA